MDREKYVQMRKSGQYDLAWFYQYYLDKKDSKVTTYSAEVFQQAFNMYLQFNGRDVLDYLDKEMQVTKIEDEQGNLLYIN
jgi:hypothetical protein